MSTNLSRGVAMPQIIDGVKSPSLGDSLPAPVRATIKKQSSSSKRPRIGSQIGPAPKIHQTRVHHGRKQPSSWLENDDTIYICFRESGEDSSSDEDNEGDDELDDEDEDNDSYSYPSDANQHGDTAEAQSPTLISIRAPFSPSSGKAATSSRPSAEQPTIFLPRLPILKLSKIQERRKAVDSLTRNQKERILQHLSGVLGVKTCDVTSEQRDVAFRVARVALETKMMKDMFDLLRITESEKQRFLSQINLTPDQTADILIRTSHHLRRPYYKLSPAEKESAINQKKIEILMSTTRTRNIRADFEIAIKEQNQVWNEENARMMANAAASMGISVGKLTRLQKDNALQRKETELCACLRRTYRIPVKFLERVDRNWRLPMAREPKRTMDQKMEEYQKVHLNVVEMAEAFKKQARELKKPVNQLTKRERRRALKDKRAQIPFQKKSAVQGRRVELRATKQQRVNWREFTE
ncbi:hypothetical protein FRC02_001959 [Tulasnella sp. 418]|nr:hypothetical protein FRC02_001959 [Tulasnella sp. 418]